MTDSSDSGGKGTKSVLLEGCLVLAVGGAVALAANYLSPRGLVLTRDYFPAPVQAAQPAAAPAAQAGGASAAARLMAQGVQVADHEQAARLFRDPRRDQELIVFVDARDEAHYAAGHLPGAYLFDRYRPEIHLPDLLPVCQTAETIVIYCTGGDCEDSEFAAVMLRDAGVPNAKLIAYPGGVTEWRSKGQPLETGPRHSGNLLGKP